MAKFKVIALNVTGIKGKVHYAKEELTDEQLGGLKRAKELVDKGFLVALEVPKKENKGSKK